MMRQMQPASKVMPKAKHVRDLRKTSRVCLSDLTTEDEVSVPAPQSPAATDCKKEQKASCIST